MSQLPRISESEWKVMEVLWSQSPLTANEVIEALEGAAEWHPKTIRSFLNRLLGKGAVGRKRSGREYRYYPTVDRDNVRYAETRSFLNRVYNGALRPMLANFLEQEDVSPAELEELRRLLDEREV